jgi:8-oxo-dGTP diphosphatase
MADLPETPTVAVVCGILRRGDRVLVARRPQGKRLAGLWEFPGGKVEPGESPESALRRELHEELRCEMVIERSLIPFTHHYEWGAIELHPFLGRLAEASQEPQALEHTELRWLATEELRALQSKMAPADVPLIQDPTHLFS